MKKAKQRVVAIDYFRGICILAVLLNHAMVFSMPFAYLAGAGRLWTSAAEMFFLLSGLTFGIVRGPLIKSRFKEILVKSWKRAGILYLVNIAAVFITLIMAYYFESHGVNTIGLGALPKWGFAETVFNIFTMNYGIGYSTIIMYYVLFLLLAPFVAYALKTKFWPLPILISVLIFTTHASNSEFGGLYYWTAIWQVYFMAGMVLARFRLPVLGLFYGLVPRARKYISTAVLALSSIALATSMLIEYNLFPTVDRLTAGGWLPWKLRAAYFHLINIKQPLDFFMVNYRTGLLRPLFTLLMLAAGYLLYQRYKKPLLSKTGKFVNTMGQQTLWVFIAQAIAIPILAALPLPRSILFNTTLTATLIYSMWLVANRRETLASITNYFNGLKISYMESKTAYLQRYEDI